MDHRWNVTSLLAAITFWILTFSGTSDSAVPCISKDYGRGSTVCVCNASYCDSLEDISKNRIKSGIVLRYESSKDGARFKKSTLNFTSESTSKERSQTITINRGKEYQEIFGFGGAFTDAASINIFSLSESAKDNLMKSYYAKEGLEYSMGRVPMASTDFSTREYSYDDVDGDFKLENFRLEKEDTKFKIPLIQYANKLRGSPLKLFATPWSAPAWMKTNGKMAGDGRMKGKPGDNYHKTWAQYYVKFLDAYKSYNISFWGLTVQNEPIDGFWPNFRFQAMAYSPTDEADFVASDLGPALSNAGYTKDRLKLMIMDDLRILLPFWPYEVFKNKTAAKYVSGIAFHWYINFLSPPAQLDLTHAMFPDKFLMATEACAGSYPWDWEHVSLGNWDRAEAYAHDILTDLLHWANGWIDWNLALDLQGGPNWVQNFVDSPIIINATADEFYKQPMFYALGHFSKLLPPGSKRIDHSSKGPIPLIGPAVEVGAFTRPDGGTVLILLNRKPFEFLVKVTDPEMGSFSTTVPANSIQSYIWWKGS